MWARLASTLVFLFDGVTWAQSPCQMRELGELPLTLVAGQPTVEVEINGRPVRMVLDTGSEGTILFRPAAQELGLALRKYPGAELFGVGGADQVASARVNTLKVANLTARNVDITVAGSRLSGEAKGVLGALFLLQSDLEFDVPGGKLRFFKPQNCKGDQVVYWGAAYAVAPMRPTTATEVKLAVTINGEELVALLDSGAGRSALTFETARRLGVSGDASRLPTNGESTGFGPQAVQNYVGQFNSFAFGDEVIKNPRLEIADLFGADKVMPLNSHIPMQAIDQPRMILGDDFLRAHRVYIALGQKKVYASYVGGPVFQPHESRSTSPQSSSK